MEVFIARQPIFDAKQTVYGYELLYRSRDENFYSQVDGDQASLSVIRNVLLVIGAQKISGGGKAFVNFTRNLLINGAASLLPKEIGVVEILEDVEPDPKLIKILSSLRSQGYPLALDDFILRGNEDNPFLEIVDIIKVDFRQTDGKEREEIAQRFSRGNRVKLLAEKTETREEFNEALEMGYTLFQGYFFCKPVIMARRDIEGYKMNHLGILKELSADSPNFKAIQKLIERDPSLTYKLLKYINSAYFGRHREITSIKQSLDLLGEYEIRRWASIAVLMELGKDHPQELLRVSLLRARLSEMLAGMLGFGGQRSAFFLMGLLSCMDALLERPMEEILEDIPIAAQAKAALLGERNSYRDVFDLVVSYERADWAAVPALASVLGIVDGEMSKIYSESIEWVDGAFE
ncbi:MAG TPA: HDOD domain-containing protein [Syntrophobacteraceae bacterium]|nr:HDOD domain-containing protein [Syntrophobacteraceae bacterium]